MSHLNNFSSWKIKIFLPTYALLLEVYKKKITLTHAK